MDKNTTKLLNIQFDHYTNWAIAINFLIFGSIGLAVYQMFPETHKQFMYQGYFTIGLFTLNCITIFLTIGLSKRYKDNELLVRNLKLFFYIITVFLSPIILVANSHILTVGFWVFPAFGYMLINQAFTYGHPLSRIARYTPVYVYILHIFLCGIQSQHHYSTELLFTVLMQGLFFHVSHYSRRSEIKSKISTTDEKDLEKTLSLYKVTTREKQVVFDLVTGLTSSEIAQKYDISENTARNHTKSIYKKLNINNRTKLVNLFMNDFEIHDAVKSPE